MRGLGFFGCISALILVVGCGAAAPTATGGAAGAQPSSANAAAEQPAKARTISVSGSASVMVVPDQVTLTLGVETSDLQLAVAKAQNDEIVQRVLAETKRLGIDPRLVQTDYMNMAPRYQDSYTQSTLIGYWVRRNVVVTLKDTTRLESLLTGCLDAGVRYVHGIQFHTSELRASRDRARSLAIQAAREKATAMAGDAGQTVGQPITIREDYTRWTSPWSSWWGGGGSVNTQNVVQNATSEPIVQRDDALAPGQIAVDASVTVEYELKTAP